ncbi:MAG TPA: DUF4230 domain-containing protein [Allosphingosinicella sp.]|jgi:hypothetical protein|nr:DUF4230 domain-containing protein [Allosphingosinicella sp.]
MDARRLKLRLLAPALGLLLLGFALGWALRPAPAAPRADAEAIAVAALLSVRDSGRVVPFSARFVSVASASETHLGLTARKTLIMPGIVRYGVDLARLRRSSLAWDEASRTLSVTLPPLELSGPDIDPDQVRESAEGGLVMALAGSEKDLDSANRRAGQDELMRQAREPRPMQIARSAAMRDVARAFALPLRAAGIEASVAVRFVDPAGKEEATWLDRPRPLEARLRDRQADR